MRISSFARSAALFVALSAACCAFAACSTQEDPSDSGASNLNGAEEACTETTPTTPPVCPQTFKPVCGCDGKTYATLCEAKAYVSGWHPGTCKGDASAGGVDAGAGDADAGACKLTPGTPAACGREYAPVCGCDGETYSNSCEAAHNVTSWGEGDCAEGDGGACKLASPKPTGCPDDYDPVCGCDGKTYANECEAAGTLTSWVDGACTK